MIKKSVKLTIKALAFLFVIAVLVFLDQLTKSLAVTGLKNSGSFVILEKVLELSYVENTGAAFGTLKGMRLFFYIFAPLVSAVLFFFSMKLSKKKKMMPLVICFLFITAGAIGNLIDRIRFGYVIDFIYVKLIDFPVFNLADIYVTCSCIALIILVFFKYKEEDFVKVH